MGRPGGDDPCAIQEKAGRAAGNPHALSARLHGSANRYKIKLRAVGYRLVYEARDAELVVSVIAVGRRDRNAVYRDSDNRH